MKFGSMEIFFVLMVVGMWGGLIWIVVHWVRYFNRNKNNGDTLNLAKQRYARGEISKDEFEDIKKNIS